MRVVSRRRLREYWEKHPDSQESLLRWYKIALNADWSSIQEIRGSFPTADGIEVNQNTRRVATVFNISGNKYRLITRVIYEYRRIYVRFVLTHNEYSRGKWQSKV